MSIHFLLRDTTRCVKIVEFVWNQSKKGIVTLSPQTERSPDTDVVPLPYTHPRTKSTAHSGLQLRVQTLRYRNSNSIGPRDLRFGRVSRVTTSFFTGPGT